MKKYACILLWSVFSLLSAQGIEGNWTGTLKTPSFELPLIIHINKTQDGYSSTFDSPKQGAKDIPFDKTSFKDGQLTAKNTAMTITYTGQLKNNEIKGTFQQNGMNFPLNLTPLKEEVHVERPQTPQPPFNFNEKEVFIKNKIDGNLLAGSLVTPKNSESKNIPIVVMITGSGAQDRNETIFKHQPFLVIANHLAQKGIASLRLDDRGVGKSESGDKAPTTANFAGDISSAVDYLVEQNYTNIGLLGHSEGGMIAPMVILKNKQVKFQILLAGPGIPIKDLLLTQMKSRMMDNGLSSEEADEKNNVNKVIYDYISDYKGKNFNNDLKAFISKQLQGKMPEEKIKTLIEKQLKTLSNPWLHYFIKFDPDVYLSKVKAPTLALNGSLDVQVSSKENLEGIAKSLRKAKNKNVKIMELKGLNHLFQTAKTGRVNEYAEITETFSPNALKIIADWIHSL